MNKKLLVFIGILGMVAAVVMYMIGSESNKLGELKDFFWIPLPLSAICLAAASKKKKEEAQ